MRLWVILEIFIYVEIWFLFNGGQLSDIILCRNPYSENIFSSAEIVQLADVDYTISTTGYREYWSIATNKYFEFDSGPRNQCLLCAMDIVKKLRVLMLEMLKFLMQRYIIQYLFRYFCFHICFFHINEINVFSKQCYRFCNT